MEKTRSRGRSQWCDYLHARSRRVVNYGDSIYSCQEWTGAGMDRMRLMETFVRVVETGNFSAVAREARTTQSAVSKQVQALEKLVGAPLLVRSSRSHSLTEAGQLYYDR